ncbi:hypothetical protein [Nostoc sp. ChiSLP03a]
MCISLEKRTKVKSDRNNPEFILTTRGSGYLFLRIISCCQE